MTIEIADRLIKLRKKYGYSQEELADKLGLSRQAVSKWERAEASPDTDNLICLAKLYGISLDELLATEDDLDTIVDEQVKGKEEPKESKEHINISDEGIRLTDDEGQTLVIDDNGIRGYAKDGHVVKHHEFVDKFIRVLNIVEGGLGLLALVAYIILGSTLGMWYNMWILFFVPEIICSLIRAIHKRNASQFNMPFTAIFTFFFVCMVVPGLDANLWHPMWVVFLAIPIYYIFVSAINKALDKKDECECECKKR